MLSKNSIYLYFSFLMLFSTGLVHAQPVPAIEENIPFLVTFGKFSETSWGDDDFIQIFYFQIPDDHQDPIYIRVFDPDCGGEHDEGKGDFRSTNDISTVRLNPKRGVAGH